uniref:F-box domain-containing protein n=1 Tax=Oryza brachyantha TaxID=4533 RepID=J3L048_ORYBR
MKAKKRKSTASAATTTTTQQPPPPPTTIVSLPDDIVADILLRLPSAAAIARAFFACRQWWRLACSTAFLRSLRAVHTYPLLLGHFATQANSPLPIFHPARLHSDSVLSAMVRRGDFLLTRLQDFGRCTLEDCNGGLLLFSTRTELIIFHPMGHHLVPIQRPRRRSFPDRGYAAHTFCLLPDLTTGGSKAACFRVISLQQRGQVVRAEVFDSGTTSWSIHPGTGTALKPARSNGNQFFPAMHAAGRIYWKYRTEPILLALDTKAMRFHYLRAPPGVTSRSPYAVGETDDGAYGGLLVIQYCCA